MWLARDKVHWHLFNDCHVSIWFETDNVAHYWLCCWYSMRNLHISKRYLGNDFISFFFLSCSLFWKMSTNFNDSQWSNITVLKIDNCDSCTLKDMNIRNIKLNLMVHILSLCFEYLMEMCHRIYYPRHWLSWSNDKAIFV